MAERYGRLHWATLLVWMRHEFKERNETAFSLRFTDRGWCSWWGADVPDEDEIKYFRTDDDAVLALLIGKGEVMGVDD